MPLLPNACRVRIVRGRMPSRVRSKVFLTSRLRFEFARLPLLRALTFSVHAPVPDHFSVGFHENVSRCVLRNTFDAVASVSNIDCSRYRWQSIFANMHGQERFIEKIDASKCTVGRETQANQLTVCACCATTPSSSRDAKRKTRVCPKLATIISFSAPGGGVINDYETDLGVLRK